MGRPGRTQHHGPVAAHEEHATSGAPPRRGATALALTCIANHYDDDFAQVFGRQVRALGREGGPLAAPSDVPLIVPGQSTARIQEAHIFVGRNLCRWWRKGWDWVDGARVEGGCEGG